PTDWRLQLPRGLPVVFQVRDTRLEPEDPPPGTFGSPRLVAEPTLRPLVVVGHCHREAADLATKGLPDHPGVATRLSGRGAYHFVDVGSRLGVARSDLA